MNFVISNFHVGGLFLYMHYLKLHLLNKYNIEVPIYKSLSQISFIQCHLLGTHNMLVVQCLHVGLFI